MKHLGMLGRRLPVTLKLADCCLLCGILSVVLQGPGRGHKEKKDSAPSLKELTEGSSSCELDLFVAQQSLCALRSNACLPDVNKEQCLRLGFLGSERARVAPGSATFVKEVHPLSECPLSACYGPHTVGQRSHFVGQMNRHH